MFQVHSKSLPWTSINVCETSKTISQHENGDLQKIKGGLNLLKAGHPTLRYQLKVVKGR